MNELIHRDLYQLIIAQLQHDGFHAVAQMLSQTALVPLHSENVGNKLATLVQVGLGKDKERDGAADGFKPTLKDEDMRLDDYNHDGKIKGLDLDVEPPPHQQFPNFTTKFITTHKNAVRVAKFAPDGKWVATGSADTSIKLLDVIKMKTYNQTKSETTDDFAPSRPVVKTFYDHSQPINDLEFHPTNPILISSSKDCTVRFYDFKSSTKRAFKCIQDTHSVRSIHIHPSGDYLLAGTEHHMIRVYDINTLQAYTCRKPTDHHFAPINMVRYAEEGNIFVSCSKDGTIKLWDAVGNFVINAIPNAHNGAEVNSVQFSKNQKYLLSCGKDGTVRLWELSTGRQIYRLVATHVGGIQQQKNRLQSTFNYNEEFIFGSDESGMAAVVWDSRTGDLAQRLTGHNNVVRYIATSPVENAVMTCSNDHRARFWLDEKP
jgi:cleavage stimulation factor subunit 1